jgi:hypothetical protein
MAKENLPTSLSHDLFYKICKKGMNGIALFPSFVYDALLGSAAVG